MHTKLMINLWLAGLLCLTSVLAATPEAPVDVRAPYDENNIFAHILRGELPARVVYENEQALAFHDIRPQARVHVLVIPKGPYANFDQFNAQASAEEKLGFLDAISRTAELMDVSESGFRLINNTGLDGGQTVAHLHFHLLGGQYVGSPREAAPGEQGAPIEALYQRYVDAWLRNDDSSEEAVLSLFSERAVIVPSGGRMMFTGHEEMRGFWFPPDAPPSTVDRFEQETIKVTLVGHEGTLLSRFRLQFTSDGVSYRTEGYNQLSAIYDRRQWRISSMMWNHPPWETVPAQPAATADPTRHEDGNPHWSPVAPQILFSSDRDGNRALYLLDADTLAIERLTRSQGTELHGSFSPDGRTIVFDSNRGGNMDLWLLDVDGGHPRALVESSDTVELVPSFSPDGRQILFNRALEGGFDVFRIDSNGHNAVNLTRRDGDDIARGWSPDGQWIAFNSNRGGHHDIYLMDRDGEQLRRITDHPGDERIAMWGPEGRYLFFSRDHEDADGGRQLIRLDLASTEEQVFFDSPNEEFYPVFSPDGQRMVVVIREESGSRLVELSATGEILKSLTQ